MAKKPVDTAIVVSVGPLIDDSDFKALETGIVYNQAGMSVDLFQETASGITKTDLTLTDGSGGNDWTHKGNGVYEVEITALQNNTKGTLWVVGVCNGVLPFESTRYEIVPANVYDAMVGGSDKLQVDTVQISGDSTAADNCEADYDGTGYDKANSTVGTAMALGTQAKADVNGEVDSALNTAIPASPTADSINERIKAIDDLTQGAGAGDLAAVLTDTNALEQRVTAGRATNLDNLDAAVSTRSSHSAADAGTDAAAKVLTTPANTLATDGGGGVNATAIEGSDATNQIQAAAEAALVAKRLDELMVAVLASQPTAGSLLADLTEDDGGTQRFTQNALEQAPGGSSGETRLREGTAQAGGASSITLDAGASGTNDHYKHCICAITAGTGAGQSQIIDSYNGTTKVATMAAAWAVVPDNTSEFVVLPLGSIPGATAPTAAQVADAVFDETRADHDAAGSFGEAINNAHAATANKKTVDRTTGDHVVYEDDNSTPRITRRVQEIDADTQGLVPQ